MSTPPPAGRSRTRTLLYSLAVLLLFVGGLHLLAQQAARRLMVRSITVEDLAIFVAEPLLQREGDRLQTSRYAQINSPRGSMPSDPDAAWRAVALGGSFLFGDPYGEPGQDPQPGGIPFFVTERLRDSEQPTSVLNLAGMGDSSIRVREKALQVLRHEPDLLLVATGNNEFPLEPPPWRFIARRIALYRILTLIGRPDEGPPDDPEELHRSGPPWPVLSAQYRANLEAIADEAGERDVPVLLATLPNNLLHRVIAEDGRWDPSREPCIAGLVAAASSQPESAPAAWLSDIAALGRGEEGSGSVESCIAEALGRWPDRAGEALQGLAGCDSEPLALAGAALVALGRPAEAVPALELWTESQPWGIRPSLNPIVRQLAAERENVHLVDLQASALEAAGSGVPGPGVFVDSCHMHWTGYAQAAWTVLGAIESEELGPAAPPAGLDFDSLARRYELPPPPPALPGLEAPQEGAAWTCPGSIPPP